MKQYSTFIYDSWDFDPAEGVIQLRYSLDDDIQFVETLTLPSSKEWPRPATYDPDDLRRALFALHIIGGISYYKTCLPKTIEIRSGSLSPSDADFWHDVYENGLGEFFYQNDIDFRGRIVFPSFGELRPKAEVPASGSSGRVLVPIGGGKDSIVTAELLRKAGFDCTLFRMGAHPFIESLAEEMQMPLITIKRALSPELFKLNEQGALNGHVPITAYLSCVTTVLSVLYGFDAVALSNERSANEGNVEFKGMEINHQWSKSIAFERAFQQFLSASVTNRVAYFSLLRPLSELKIAELLTKWPKYLRHFTSCNKNWKILGEKQDKRWCGQCPKCAFSYALLAAFLPKKDLHAVFGSEFFDAAALEPYYCEMLGLQGHKPFECVGTPEETAAAFWLAHKRGELERTRMMKVFLEEALSRFGTPDALVQDAMTVSPDHAVPEEFKKALPRS